MKKMIVAALLALPMCMQAQQDSAFSLHISGYLETYAAYDFAKPENHTRPSFVYSFNRTGELNNATLTRSMAADNSAYYETGVKLSYATDDGKWQLSALVLNGWQRIQRPVGNHTPAFGHQLVFMPKSGITLNSSSFIGNDRPDSTRRMSCFHNLYGIFDLGRNIQVTTGFDIGMEQEEKASRSFHHWYAPVAIVRWKLKEGRWLAARAEQYSDRSEVIVSTPQGSGFETWSFGLNYDWTLFEKMLWRMEIRTFSGKDDYFGSAAKPSSRNTILTSSLSIFFP